jgi:hypothetical protein
MLLLSKKNYKFDLKDKIKNDCYYYCYCYYDY